MRKLKGSIVIMCEEINNIKAAYYTVEKVNDGLKKYVLKSEFYEAINFQNKILMRTFSIQQVILRVGQR